MGRLNVCLYGTRTAARGLQEALSKHLEGLCFVRGRGFLAVFPHPKWNMNTLVHGDDYCSVGSKEALGWLERELKNQHQAKTSRVCEIQGENSEANILNRVVRKTRHGFELEGDQRHVELVIEQVLQPGANGCSNPGSETIGDDKEDELDLKGEEVKRFRGLAARCLFISLGRPEMQYCQRVLPGDVGADHQCVMPTSKSEPVQSLWTRPRAVQRGSHGRDFVKLSMCMGISTGQPPE